jgi:hypothetical protein
MGDHSANLHGETHFTSGAIVGVRIRLHFGDYSIDTAPSPEITRAAALTIQGAAAQSDAATISAVLASGWAAWWTATANALNAAGAPQGTLVTAARGWLGSVTF